MSSATELPALRDAAAAHTRPMPPLPILCTLHKRHGTLLLMHTDILLSAQWKKKKRGIALRDRISIFACLWVKISGPQGAARLSCSPVAVPPPPGHLWCLLSCVNADVRQHPE